MATPIVKLREDSSTIKQNTVVKVVGDIGSFISGILLFIPLVEPELRAAMPDSLQPYLDTIFAVCVLFSLYSRYNIAQRERTGIPIMGTPGEERVREALNELHANS